MTGLIKNSLSKYVSDEEENYFDAIDQASTRIIRTIDMILNYSRLQVGDFPVKISTFDLTEAIDNLIHEQKNSAGIKSIELSFENKCGDVNLTADKYCITQAISNLIV